jgi:hypothetical protein
MGNITQLAKLNQTGSNPFYLHGLKVIYSKIKMAERTGFEPVEGVTPFTSLAN